MKPTKNNLDPARLPPTLTTDMMAAITGLNVVTIQRKVRSGEIEANKLGRKMAYSAQGGREILMTYKKHIPRCDDDCEHCKRSVEKCHGGSDRRAYDARQKVVGKPGAKIKSQAGTGHKACRGRLGRM